MRPEWKNPDFQKSVGENLREGNYTLVIAVDEMNDNLMTTIDFINTCKLQNISINVLLDLTIALLEILKSASPSIWRFQTKGCSFITAAIFGLKLIFLFRPSRKSLSKWVRINKETIRFYQRKQ